MLLQAFDMKVVHIAGRDNVVADALSREPFIAIDPETREAMSRGDEALAELLGAVVSERSEESEAVEDAVPQWSVTGGSGMGEVEEWWSSMRDEQLRDEELAGWMKSLAEGASISKDKGELVMDRDVLFKRERDGTMRLVVPASMRAELLRSMHEDVRTGGHFGARRALARARKHWWWPRMFTDMEQWVDTCRVCRAYEMRRGIPKAVPDLPRMVPNRPWASVYVDAVGPLPRGENGHMYVLVAIDHFTRWAEVKAVRRLTADTFVEWLQQDLIGRWGPMTRLTTDRGSNFMADVAAAVHQAVGIDRHRITAWRPQSNGLVERFNGTLKQMLKAYAEETGARWPTGIKNYMYAYNTAVHSATGFTPFYLMHGWEAKLPYELLLEQRGQSEYRSVNRYVEDLIVAVNDAWTMAAAEMSEGDRKRQWSPATTPRQRNGVPRFEEGQLVWVSKPFHSPGESKATRQMWYGPYTILRRLSDLVYVVDRDGAEDEIHVDRLKRYRSLDQDGPRTRYLQHAELEQRESEAAAGSDEMESDEVSEGESCPVQEIRFQDEEATAEEVAEARELEELRRVEERENTFEVEAILDSRVRRRSARLESGTSKEYLIKWKYWPDTDATWEREENLDGCRDLVDEFDRMHKIV
jgi:transposase InsO family protein